MIRSRSPRLTAPAAIPIVAVSELPVVKSPFADTDPVHLTGGGLIWVTSRSATGCGAPPGTGTSRMLPAGPDITQILGAGAVCDVGSLTNASDITVNPVTNDGDVICNGTGKVTLSIQNAAMSLNWLCAGSSVTVTPANPASRRRNKAICQRVTTSFGENVVVVVPLEMPN